jgi:hypothetical protein
MAWVLQEGKVDFNASDFDNDAARQEKATSGEELVRLTNWSSGNTSRPLIQAGSKIVVNNTLFYTDSDTALINDPGGLVDGEVFIRFEKTGTDPSFSLNAYLTNDDPRSVAEFDAAKGGWYEPGTNNKYSDIIMEVSGSLSSFDKKGNQNIDNGTREYLNGSIELADIASGSFLMSSSDVEETGDNNTSYVKVKEIIMPAKGVVSVSFDMLRTQVTGTTTALGRIYVNGVATGTERSTTLNSYTTYTEDINVNAGDYLQLYCRVSDTTRLWQVRNFRVKTDKEFIGLTKAILLGGLNTKERLYAGDYTP